MKILFLIFGVLLLKSQASRRPINRRDRFKEEFTWTKIKYIWPNDTKNLYGFYETPTDAITNEENNEAPPNVNYKFENNIPMGANLWRNKLFITVPRRRGGVPSSLNYVDMNNPERHNVPLKPYPNWNVNRLDKKGSDKIVSVYRIAIDECNRAWMVDTGIVDVLGNGTKVLPTSVVIIDLNKDKIIRRYDLPPNTLRPTTEPANIVVDSNSKSCDDSYAYIPDLGGFGLIVYSYKQNLAWRVIHNYFYLEPLRGDLSIAGFQFQWDDGIFSGGLSKIQKDGYRTFYFHAMAGTNLYSVSTKILRDQKLATRAYHGNDFKFLGDRGDLAQTSGSSLHQPSGIMFFNLVNQNGLSCWNTNKPFAKENFVTLQTDNKRMIYPSDNKISGNKIIVMTNKMPIFLYGKLNYDETNFRAWITNVDGAVKHTKCV